ncbi:tyrosine-type recombinase/integrase [Luteimicrobium subarcticum]|uniref:Site-specific recombinase XerD n=1 Tax=Luteimicrobium subarcticum TaxID=620910 RepID=A0A2M8W3R8_9MICO|nr:tyrosine-type recombinase/integrase [Luteimicrobium subarcticum]PJI85571.1 site-specific recombinase XerD [Luteimicrobium subarcticum]
MASPPPVDRIEVGEAVRRYLATVDSETVRGILARTTRDTYHRDLREFARLAGPATVLDDIEGEDVDDLLVRYQTAPDGRYRDAARKEGGPGKATASVNRFRQSVSRFFAHATRQAWVQANPFQWAAPPARDRDGLRVERTALTQSTARALLAADPAPAARPDQDLAARDRLVLALLLVVGPRVSELARADLADVVREPGAARWRIRGKGGVVRTVSLSAPLEAALDEYLTDLRPRLAARGTGPDAERALLLSWRGRRVDPQTVRALLNRAMARVPANLRRGATPHALRHTTATLLVAHGWDVKVVAELLGHASIATTGVYLDRIEGELAAAIAAHPLLPASAGGPDGTTDARTSA